MRVDRFVVGEFGPDGFSVQWRPAGLGYEVWTSDRLVPGPLLLTAQHVIAEIGWDRLSGRGEFIDRLLALDEMVSAEFGDPFVVGDETVGSIGLATPDGESVPVLLGPGLVWTYRSAPAYRYTIRTVLDGVAPATLRPNDTLPEELEARIEQLIDAGLPDGETSPLGLNMRALESWLVAELADGGGPGRSTTSGSHDLDALSKVSDEAFWRALTELRDQAQARSARAGRPRLLGRSESPGRHEGHR